MLRLLWYSACKGMYFICTGYVIPDNHISCNPVVKKFKVTSNRFSETCDDIQTSKIALS